MKNLFLRTLFNQKKFIVVILSLFCSTTVFSQNLNPKQKSNQPKVVQKQAPTKAKADPDLQKKVQTKQDVKIEVKKILPEADTVMDFSPFLVSKQNCDFEKILNEDGCIIIKYNDGLIKKFCNGTLIEVITADGRKHVLRFAPSMRNFVVPVPEPENPSTADIAYNWIVAYNEYLLNEISKLIWKTQFSLDQFTKREKIICNNNIYKEIEYRTIFIQEILKAK